MGFAEGASANVTEPSAGILENGYQDSAIPPAAEWNWILRQAHKVGAPFATTREGLDACSLGECFAVLAGASTPGVELDSWSYSSGARLYCDGRRVFGLTPTAVTAWLTDGTELWELANTEICTAGNLVCLDYAGGLVWVTTDDSGGEVFLAGIDAELGVVRVEFTLGVDQDPPLCLSAWGEESGGLVVVDDQNGSVLCYSWEYDGSTYACAYEWTYYHAAEIHDLAIDFSRVFLCGDQGATGSGTGKTVVCLTHAGSYAGGFAGNSPARSNIHADGERLYLAQRGGDETIQCLDRLALTALWAAAPDITLTDVTTGQSGEPDDRALYLIAGGASARIYALAKRDGAILWVSEAWGYEAACSDGSRCYALAGGATPEIQVLSSAPKTRQLCKVDGSALFSSAD